MAITAAHDLNEIITACEEGVARRRAEYSPDTGGRGQCDSCGGELLANYMPLGLSNGSGDSVWVHIGACHQQFVDNRRLAAEREFGALGIHG